jgi:hypothetical protein
MLRIKSIALTVVALITAYGCAGPQLRVPQPSQEIVERERQHQQDLAFKNFIEAQVRLFRVYAQIRTSGAELCGNNVKPFAGLFLKDLNSFIQDERQRAVRVLGIDHNLRVIAAGPPATDAGIRTGDVIRKIAGTVLEPQSRNPFSSEVEAAMRLLDKAALKPVEIEVKRPEGNATLIVTPKPACRFGIVLQDEKTVNAAADGEHIYIPTGMLRFAESDDELALVLGHELAHNALQHIERQKSNRALGGVVGVMFDIAAAAAGVNTGAAGMRAGAQVGAKAYSQAFEAEADYLGLYFASRAGFDVSKAPELWRKMGAQNPGAIQERYGATHPSTPERAAALEEALKEILSKQSKGEPLVPTRLDTPNSEQDEAR